MMVKYKMVDYHDQYMGLSYCPTKQYTAQQSTTVKIKGYIDFVADPITQCIIGCFCTFVQL